MSSKSRNRRPRRLKFGLRVLAMGLDPETGQEVAKVFTIKSRAGMRRVVEGITACGYSALAFRNLGPAPCPEARP